MFHLRLSKQETAAPITVTPPAAETASDPLDARIEAYLNRIEAAMTALPPHERAERCRELRQHLDATRAALEELGDTSEIAVAEALHRFGEAEMVALRFNSAWTQTAKRRLESPWPAIRLSLRWFGIGYAAFLAGSVLALRCGYPFWASPQWSFAALVGTPCLLGMAVGAQAPKRAGMGTFYALTALTLCSVPLIKSVRTSSDFLATAIPPVMIFVFWIPLGCLAATVASWAVRAHQARRRLRTN